MAVGSCVGGWGLVVRRGWFVGFKGFLWLRADLRRIRWVAQFG
jgi:hypothetical protein